MTDDGVIDVEAVEIGTEVALRPSQEVTLFSTQDPTEIVVKATEIATVLADVLKKQKLTTTISGRDHVRVEGWTLCGTFLGVFPVCVWTRPLEEGWEARVEARTRDGAVVGAAEAECLRTETKWKGRDDYALRSMAQTRATSKALRLPLGFIVALAGFDATPAEEMDTASGTENASRGGRAPQETKPFDVTNQLLPGAISGDNFMKRVAEALNAMDPKVDWQDVIDQGVQAVWSTKGSWRDLEGDAWKEFCHRLANAVEWIVQASGGAEFPDHTTIVAGFAYAFNGAVVELTQKTSDAALTPEQQAEMRRLEEQAAADPPGTTGAYREDS